MTRGKRFKRLVRARAAETGQSYTAALRRFQPKPEEGYSMTSTANTEPLKCSFCGKPQDHVAKLVAGPGVSICDQCIRLGYDIVGDERQPDDGSGVRRVMPPFTRFTERASTAVVEAQQAARELHHNFLGTEHVLLGVLAAADERLLDLLSSHGVSADTVRMTVTQLVEPSQAPHLAAPPFTPRALRSLELAGEQATLLGQERVDVAHLMLGVLAEGHGIASQLLRNFGVDIDDVRALTSR